MSSKLTGFIEHIASEREFSPSTAKVLSLICLLVAVGISLMSFDTKRFIFLKGTLNITPDFLSGAVSIVLLMPLYARGILRWSRSVYGLITLFLLWWIFASIIQIAFQGKTVDIPEYLVFGAVALSWLGMRGIAGVAWILAFAACVLSAIKVSNAMGGWGFLFVTSGFIGCFLHSGLSPSHFMEEIRQEFHAGASDASRRISKDVRAAKELL